MAYDSNSGADQWNQLIEVSLTGFTWRVANKWLALSDGTQWEGRIKNMTPLVRAVGGLLDPRVISPRMQIAIDNSDDTPTSTTSPRGIADRYEFANRQVTVKVGQGITAADYTTVFIGAVHFPGGIIWDDNLLYLDLDDIRERDNRVLPINKFFSSTYPNMEEKSKNLPIPLVYGDWRSTATPALKVPCFQIDSTVGIGGRFKIADHALKQIETVYKNGVSVSFSSTDLTNAQFVLDVAYDPAVDTITAHVQGATHDGTSGGNLLQSLPDILEDILKTRLGVSAGNVDSTAFAAWEANLGASDYGRRVIDDEISSHTLISQILVDGFADMHIVGGKYYPVYRIVDPSAGIDTYHDFDIDDGPGGAKAFRVERDQERVYANQIVAEYAYDPVNTKYNSRYDAEDSWAISQTQTRRRRRLTMTWLYVQAGAEARADRERYVFATEVETAVIDLTARALTKAPTDQFRLIYSKYEIGSGIGTPFQIREVSTDFQRMRARVKAWNMNNLSPGRWTGSGATTWLLSTAWERQTQGYWCDASGNADTSGSPDPVSKRSRWF